MARIPLEDNFDDVINKAQRGLKISDADLAKRAEVPPADLAAVKAGQPIDAVLRRVARHLRLSATALETLAHKRWYPQQPIFPAGFAAFNTRYEDMTVNSYLIWDARTKVAAAFDTGATCEPMLDLLRAEKQLDWTFLSPSAMFIPGERTGTFRLGTDLLLSNENGSSISFEDFAIALVDELEKPAHSRARFTVGY